MRTISRSASARPVPAPWGAPQSRAALCGPYAGTGRACLHGGGALPRGALALLETLARRVRRFAELAGDLAFREVTERVARYLQATAAAGGEAVAPRAEIELALTQEQLAARVGTVRELVARALAQLRRGRVIAQRRRRITILDPGRLAALGRGEERLGSGGSGKS